MPMDEFDEAYKRAMKMKQKDLAGEYAMNVQADTWKVPGGTHDKPGGHMPDAGETAIFISRAYCTHCGFYIWGDGRKWDSYKCADNQFHTIIAIGRRL